MPFEVIQSRRQLLVLHLVGGEHDVAHLGGGLELVHLLLEPRDGGGAVLHQLLHLVRVLALEAQLDLRGVHQLLQLLLVLLLLLIKDLLERLLVVLGVVLKLLNLHPQLLLHSLRLGVVVAHLRLVLGRLRLEQALAPLLNGFDLLAQLVIPLHLHRQLELILVLELLGHLDVVVLLPLHNVQVLALGLVVQLLQVREPRLLRRHKVVLLLVHALDLDLPVQVLTVECKVVVGFHLLHFLAHVVHLAPAVLQLLERDLHHVKVEEREVEPGLHAQLQRAHAIAFALRRGAVAALLGGALALCGDGAALGRNR
mmetsp:Transcript_61330/g.168338  ORF Transcript_61330/g.168338 Transcript_61330/m.168338 type:complete len:312 (-) Transcript_61330:2412-3347(-)